MQGFGILFIAFGVCTFLYGVYIAAGHNPLVKRGTVITRLNLSKEELKHVGKITEVMSIPITLTGISGLFFEEENIIPVVVLVVGVTLTIIIIRSIRKKKEEK